MKYFNGQKHFGAYEFILGQQAAGANSRPLPYLKAHGKSLR